MPKDNEVDEKAVAWLITYTERDGSKRQAVYTHNAIADWRMFDPAATSEPLYSAATVVELRAKADAAERRVGELEANDRRYRFLRRKLCVTGNGDGTCAMQAINLPHRIHGWPEHGEHEQFFDAAIDSYLTGADPT